MTFAAKLSTLRKEKGLSIEKLADMLGVSCLTVCEWEVEQATPESDKLISLSKIFDVSIDQLLREDLDIDQAVSNQEENEVIYCSQCGRKNKADSAFCGYCGHPFSQIAAHKPTLSKEEIDLAYYKANLQMQQQALEETRKQTEQQRQQLELQQEQYRKMKKCPRCGSTSLATNKKGYGIGKGVVGAALLGPIGLVAGNIGSHKVMVTCMNCGYKFKI